MFNKKSKGTTAKKRKETDGEIPENINGAGSDTEPKTQIPCEHLGIGALVKFNVVSATDKE